MDAINRFDKSLSSALQSWPSWVQPIMSTATFLGEPVVLIGIAGFGALIAYRRTQPKVVAALGGTIAAWGFNAILKFFLHRTRPDTLYVTGMRFKTYSFPSGHAFGATVVYGLLSYLAYHHLPNPWNIISSCLLGGLIIMIGLSRVYLGAHFPTDVIAGWLLGGLFLGLIIKFILLR